MVFLEQRLELGLNFDASYGPRFSTAIATQSDGQEQRRAMWSQPLIVANLAGRAVDKIELDYLLDFHASVKGSAYGFRLRDWSDYKSGLTAIGTGNGTTQTWQLIKRYTVGSYTVTRPITKPVANSLTLYLNGIATATGWSLNTTTGVLTTTLTGAIAVDFEFDVPVRFAEDQIKFTFEAADPFDATRRIFTLDALTCTEIRIEPTIYPAIEPLPPSMPLFDLGYDYGTNGGPQFDTGIASTASEFEARIPYLDTPKGSWNIGDRTLDRAQVDYFLAFYRLCRGMAVPFSFKDWQDETTKPVRFAEDRISLQFNAYRPHDQQVIFYLGGLAIVETPPPTIPTWTLTLRYKSNTADPFTNLFLTFEAISVEFILLGEYNNLSGAIGASGFPSVNYFENTVGGETLYVQVLITDLNGVRYLQQEDLIEPTQIEIGNFPQINWVIVGDPAENDGDLQLFEFVSLVEN